MNTFGSDPEFMLFDNTEPKSAIGVVDGCVESRIEKNGHSFYYDNVLAECAIEPGRNREEVVANFRDCFKIYAKMVQPYRLTPRASAYFSNRELSHEDAKKVNCDRDTCAYTMRTMQGPVEAILNGNLRSCGGHIHAGAEILREDGAEPVLFIYMMDLFLGMPSLWLDHDPTSSQRRQLYGQAGRYRVKDYGMEYRSLGNFWLESPSLVELVYDITMFCIQFVECGDAWKLWEFDFDKFLGSTEFSSAWTCKAYDAKKLMNAINNSDKNSGSEFMKLAESLMPKDLFNRITESINRTQHTDFYESWELS